MVQLRDGVLWHPVGDELAVFSEDGASVFTANEAAAIVIQSLASNHTLDEIATQLSQRFGAEVGLCRRLAESFVSQLRAEGLADLG